ncbi:MAG TPA: phosphoadenylyl-sulfate reductase [Beijerinckiaceae bacterium]|nr:phosphoadenylyl-sulfate reductase [Beijerinckiaceae bacterium]
MSITKNHVPVVLSALGAATSLAERLARIRREVTGRIVFTTSFGLEDQVLADAIFTSGHDIEVVTLDTGRLFPETYDVWAATEERCRRRIVAYAPETDAVEHLVASQGIDGFRASVDARVACCGVRKVAPLRRALAGAAAWITGLRAEQSRDRAGVPLAEFDGAHGLIKLNPLADWTRRDVERFVADRGIPYNLLHDRGFPSIGCAPCTRAVRVGEPERAGRWWWEADAKKECGLHVRPAAEPALLPRNSGAI